MKKLSYLENFKENFAIFWKYYRNFRENLGKPLENFREFSYLVEKFTEAAQGVFFGGNARAT